MRVQSSGASLAVYESGAADGPTVILVHGYPDTHAVWDEVVALLADRFHVVTYDTRGMGASTAPVGSDDAYALPALAADLRAVAQAVQPGRPVHVVGHDWGAFEVWEALTDGQENTGAVPPRPDDPPAPVTRIASFTAIAGPRIDDRGRWLARRLRLRPAALAEIAAQARRSWYVAAIQLSVVPELFARRVVAPSWRGVLRRLERVDPRPGHPAPTLASDLVAGFALYRTNLRRRPPAAAVVPARIPVQLVVPTRDRYLSTGFYADADGWATRLWRRDIRAGHWVQRSHPAPVARAITELVDHVEGAPEAPALRRARRVNPGDAGRVNPGDPGGNPGDARRGNPGDADGNPVAVAPPPLAGRLAVVTGAGSGIGRATALAFARAGAEVVCADVDLAAAGATAAAGKGKAALSPIEVDVSDAAAMERFAAAVHADHGVPEIVVNNAGIGMSGPFLETTQADWERIIDVNLWGVIHGSRLFARMMVDAGQEGHIINLASAAAYAPSRMLPAYSTTKAAVLMLSECMRAELGEQGIRVSAICPGFVNTNITRTTHFVGVDAETEDELQLQAARSYARRGYPPERVADAIVKAIGSDRALVPVTPEARVLLALARVAPRALRRLARLDL
jgi:NAD(P)-dependent dehydrogenase (short-subunit alcohol dehydrogenase family)/pimeloyl-ACP methyl ester carboxylesterase